MSDAKQPFQFMSASTITQICGSQANTIRELLEEIRRASDASIFTHTFQTLEEHHFFTAGFSNDFAHWVLTACNEPRLAEQLAALDIRQYKTIGSLRGDLINILQDYVENNPPQADRPAFEPFYLSEAQTVAVPAGRVACDLASFAEALQELGLDSIHYHFIVARLRPPLGVNDFCNWISSSLDLPELARRIDAIDIYTNTLEGLRQRILEEISAWMSASS